MKTKTTQDLSKILVFEKTISSQITESLAGHKYLISFSMLFMIIMLCNSILTNRYISLGDTLFVLGGTFTSPLIFILSDIIAEIYGYKIAKYIILCGYFCQAIFAIVCTLVIRAPVPAFFKDYQVYSSVFGPLLYIVISSFIAFVISGLINIHIITRWKLLMHGRYFWLRSLGSSTIAEALYSAIAIIMMEIGSIPANNIFKVILTSYLIKVIYSIIFAAPGNALVSYIKLTTNIDVYDTPRSFSQLKENNTVVSEVS